MSEMLQTMLGVNDTVEGEVFIRRCNGYFKIQGISSATLQRLQEQATHYTGRGDSRKKVLDSEEFSSLIIAQGCVDPDFNNDALKKKHDATDAADCVRKSLLAGEAVKLQDAILKLSGFSSDEDDEYGDIKN